MSIIAQALGMVAPGAPRTAGRLTVFPLAGPGTASPSYLLLDEALADGCVSITEVTEAGHVPELRIENRAAQPVLVVDGEALAGARQNRIVNITVMVAAKSVTTLPVSCVEQGRWSYARRDFSAADHVLYSASRARKAHDVTASLAATGERRADQGAIWQDIAMKSSRFGAQSRSEAMSAIFEQRELDLSVLEAQFEPRPDERGAVFVIDGRIVGLELFDAPATWRTFAPKVLRSYGLDALDAGVGGGSDGEMDAAEWLRRLAVAPAKWFASAGVGEDVRFEGGDFAGGALVIDGRVVHCSAFDMAAWRAAR